MLKKHLLIELQGGALFFAIVIGMLMLLIVNTIMLIGLYSAKETILLQEKGKAHDSCFSAINSLIAAKGEMPIKTPQAPPIAVEDIFPVSIKKDYWGAFILAQAFQQRNHVNETLDCLLGAKIDKKDRIAILLETTNSTFSVAGNSSIDGNIVIPNNRLKRAYLPSKPFTGDISRAKILDKKVKLPEINKELISNNMSYLDGEYSIDSFLVSSIEECRTWAPVIHPFNKKTLLIESEENIVLDRIKISGNVIIVSKTRIDVYNNALLDNIILFAPDIQIHEGFKGQIQAWSSSSVIIEENCTLYSPSFLGVIGEGNKLLQLKRSSSIIGDIYISGSVDNSKVSRAYIEKKAVVNGYLYSMVPVELNGCVYGSIYCSGFINNTNHKLYSNHLIDATVSSSGLPSTYIGSAIF